VAACVFGYQGFTGQEKKGTKRGVFSTVLARFWIWVAPTSRNPVLNRKTVVNRFTCFSP
jgi:hypothetical protein